MLKMILTTLKRSILKTKNYLSNQTTTPSGTDWVGYESLIDVVYSKNLLSIEGDFVEIGTFLGGGALKLSKFLSDNKSKKRLFVIDVFDPEFDWTQNIEGNTMASYYNKALAKYKGKKQLDIFMQVTSSCSNIVLVQSDSMNLNLQTEKICFGFIDGNHDPEYVENDFYIIWKKLSSGGIVAFHDYGGDLPQTTQKIDFLKEKHYLQISDIIFDKDKNIIYLLKK